MSDATQLPRGAGLVSLLSAAPIAVQSLSARVTSAQQVRTRHAVTLSNSSRAARGPLKATPSRSTHSTHT